jgi:hypothetical protein
MIRILSVQGEVLVDDKRRGYQQMARAGMILEDGGDYLVATNASSSVHIDTGTGETVRLGPLSFFTFGPHRRTWWGRHGLAPGGDMRRWLGLIWAKMGGECKDDMISGSGGIRG